jgi:hypothetical protein
VVALTYQFGATQYVDLINATVESDLFEDPASNNTDQTGTPLFKISPKTLSSGIVHPRADAGLGGHDS